VASKPTTLSVYVPKDQMDKRLIERLCNVCYILRGYQERTVERVASSYLVLVMTVLQPLLLFVHNQSILFHSNTRRVLRKSPVEGAFVLASRRSGVASREWYHIRRDLLASRNMRRSGIWGAISKEKEGKLGAKWRVIGGILILGILVFGTMGWAATLEVGPGKTYTTIQAAIDAANANDTINVAVGTYAETIDISTNNLTIQSVSGDPGNTIIQANVKNDNVVEITSCSGVTFSGFTVQGSDEISDAEVWGVYMDDTSSCSLSDIDITEIESTAGNNGGLFLDDTTNPNDNNAFNSITISDISGPSNVYGLIVRSGNGNSFTNTDISNITAPAGVVEAISFNWASNCTFESTTIHNIGNIVTTQAIGFYIYGVVSEADNNTFTDTDINNITANGNASGINQWAYVAENTFTATTISNITSQTSDVYGIFAFGYNNGNTYDNTEISHVTASAGVALGIYFNFPGNSGNVFDTTTITDIEGHTGAAGIYLYKKDSNNAFTSTDIADVTASDGDSCGIKLKYDVTGNSFTSGSITGAKYGVYLLGSADKGDASTNSIHLSDISENSHYGVLNDNVDASFDATNNWWGDNSGPSGEGPGTGDAVSTNVNYDPWTTIVSLPPAGITVEAGLLDIPADGTSTTGLTATVIDAEGDLVSNGTNVVFETDHGTVGSSTITKQTIDGKATATLTSVLSSEAVTATVTATTDGGVKDATAVFFIPVGDDAVLTESETVIISGSGTVSTGDTASGMGSVHIDGAGETIVTTAKYDENPEGAATFNASGDYYDVHLEEDSGVNSLTVEFCGVTASTIIYYWGGTSWIRASAQTYADGCITVTITADTQPSLSDLSGLPFASSSVTCGDINDDGYINVLDARLCLQIATGFITPTAAQEAAADVDGDGDVDLDDAELLAKYIIGMEDKLGGE